MTTIDHNAGFFSNCSVRLHYIVKYLNEHGHLPPFVDSSRSFDWYKKKDGDITFEYFKHYDTIDIEVPARPVDYHWDKQFENYKTCIDYPVISHLVNKYFTPSEKIIENVEFLKNKYCIDYTNTCAIFHRGTDKINETEIPDFSVYINKAREILEREPDIRFLLQSDDTKFIEKLTNEFPDNSFYFKDEIIHVDLNLSVDQWRQVRGIPFYHGYFYKKTSDHFEYSKMFLAVILVMAKCKHVVCGSGNCSVWLVKYRGGSHGVHQFLNGILV